MDASTEREIRLKVWTALSDVFLDTETRWYFPQIALVLAASGYTARELDRIWFFEVVPEFSANLLTVAGEWAALPVDEASLWRRASRRPRLIDRLWAAGPWALRGHWRAILALRRALEPEGDRDRAARVAAWSAYAEVYLEPSLDRVILLDDLVARLRETDLGSARATATFEATFRPVYRALLEPPERNNETLRAANVAHLVRRAFG